MDDQEKLKGCIPKDKLEAGKYYKGRCRNASVARWDGKRFRHWRTKFGNTFLEYIHCPEDEKVFDVFYAYEVIDKPGDNVKYIPLEDK